MKTSIIITIILIVLFALLQILEFILRRKTENNLTRLLLERKFDEFDAISNKSLTKFLVYPYNLLSFKLNKAIMIENEEAIIENANLLKKLKLNDAQKEKYLTNVFYYFMNKDNKAFSKEYYDQLLELNVVHNEYMIKMMYNTFSLDGYEYLDEAIESLNGCSEKDRPIFESLISTMYANKGDKKLAKEYRKLSDEHTKQLHNK